VRAISLELDIPERHGQWRLPGITRVAIGHPRRMDDHARRDHTINGSCWAAPQ